MGNRGWGLVALRVVSAFILLALASANGQTLTAVVYVMVPGNPSAQRAFTILGSTGRIRTYRWTGSQWILQ